MKKNKLVFDLGFHNGDDTDFYLKRGFDVVAVDADPKLVRAGIKRFHDAIMKKRLILVHKAIAGEVGKGEFYLNLKRSDWSSCNKKLAEIDGSHSKAVPVTTTTFTELCKDFGVPFYAKVDIEGNDVIVAEQLCGLMKKPIYVSFELSKQNFAGLFSWLYVAGYKKFQLVNQLKNPERKISQLKVGKGRNMNYQFSKYSSGFFGKDLPANKWLSYDEALAHYMKYRELKIIDNQELALGWLDLHASL